MILLNSWKSLKSCKDLTRHLLLINAVLLALAALNVFFTDQWLARYFAQDSLLSVRDFARGITNIGLSEHYFIGSIFLYCYFRWLAPHLKLWQQHSAKAQFLKIWALNFFVALITSGILVHIGKFLFGRQRPHKSAPLFDPLVFEPFNTHWHWHSFPSGHSQTMLTAATMMCIAFPKLKWLWVMVAIAVCFTRVMGHDHFFSDTIYGACIGYSGTLIALYLMRTKTKHGL